MSEIINKPQPPVVRSGCKAPPPLRRIPAGPGKPGTKKGDSFESPSLSCPTKLFVAARSFGFLGAARLGRIALLGTAGFGRVTCLGIALRVAAGTSRSFGRNGGSLALGSLLVRITAAAYHCNGSHYDNKGKDLFHSVKGLIISYSVTSQRYIFARILQIKNFNIFKVFACFRQAGTAAACRLCQAQKTKKGIQLFSSKGLPWRTPRS